MAAAAKKVTKSSKAKSKKVAKVSTLDKRAQQVADRAGEGTSGGMIRDLLRKGKLSNAEILAVVLKKFKGNTTAKDVSWNRYMLRRAGEDIVTVVSE